MSRLLIATLLVVGGFAPAHGAEPHVADASGADAMQSAACREAVAALQAEEQAAAAAPLPAKSGTDAARRKPPTSLESARRHAARACLASRADALPLPQRLAEPPVTVPRIIVTPAPAGALTPPADAPPAARLRSNPPGPGFIMSCDAVGCWASDGTRLNRVGPNLWGGRGACTVQGTLLRCP